MSDSQPDGVQSWTESMSARERIRAIATTLREPRSINWISEQADASWDTTKSELEVLDQRGEVRCVEGGDSTLYQPDYTRLLFDEIRRLIEENTREELRDGLDSIADKIGSWQESYDVESWEDLEQSLADDSLSAEERRERRDVVTHWRESEDSRDIITHALSLYSAVESVQEQPPAVVGHAEENR